MVESVSAILETPFMQPVRFSQALLWVAVVLYIIGAVAWAGVDLAAHAASATSPFAAMVYNPNTWAFLGWEGIFILGGLTVRAMVIRLTE
jgi:hypothetical protein